MKQCSMCEPCAQTGATVQATAPRRTMKPGPGWRGLALGAQPQPLISPSGNTSGHKPDPLRSPRSPAERVVCVTGKPDAKPPDTSPVKVPGSEALPSDAPAKPPPATASAPKLDKKPISEPRGRSCGDVGWDIQWILDRATDRGGWVVQKVELQQQVTDCDGRPIDLMHVYGRQWPLWEAWPIAPGKQQTSDGMAGVFDDSYSFTSPGRRTHGQYTLNGTTAFYEALTLPPSFSIVPWGIPTTFTDPKLGSGSGEIPHVLTAIWDCCGSETATEVKSI